VVLILFSVPLSRISFLILLERWRDEYSRREEGREMKKVIELLIEIRTDIIDHFHSPEKVKKFMGKDIVGALNEAIVMIKNLPSWETPEQYRDRTGQDWPENALVYYRYAGARETYEGIYYDEFDGEWGYAAYKRICGFAREAEKHKNGRYQIICVGEAGCPPKNWRP
jgi:hypothetical protein